MVGQLALYSLDRADDTLVIRRQEPHDREDEQAGVELTRAVRPNEAAAPGIGPSPADVVVDLGSELSPPVDRALAPEALHGPNSPVDAHPGHDFTVGELSRTGAHLPNTLVWLVPLDLNVVDESTQQRPRRRVRGHARKAGSLEGVQDLAADIQLNLR